MIFSVRCSVCRGELGVDLINEEILVRPCGDCKQETVNDVMGMAFSKSNEGMSATVTGFNEIEVTVGVESGNG